MIKKGVVFLFLLCFALTACSTSLPPDPGASVGAPVGDAVRYYQGWAPPYDFHATNGPYRVFTLDSDHVAFDPAAQFYSLDLKGHHPGGFIWNTGYYYTRNGWRSFTFPQNTVRNSKWIHKEAELSLSVPAADVDVGENYIAVYSCRKHDGGWNKCGCTSETGTCGKWMLVSYDVMDDDLPPEPPGLGDLYLATASILPRGNMIELGDSVTAGVHYISVQENLQTVSNTINIISDDPSAAIAEMNLDLDPLYVGREGGMLCAGADLGEDSESGETVIQEEEGFHCTKSFSREYTPSAVGEYTVEVVGLPDWVNMHEGHFKVVEDGFFAQYLVTPGTTNFPLTDQIGVSSKVEYVSGLYDGSTSSAKATVYLDDADYRTIVDRYPDRYNIIEFDGSYVHYRDGDYGFAEGDGLWEEFIWFGNDITVVINHGGSNLDDISELLAAFLALHPSEVPPEGSSGGSGGGGGEGGSMDLSACWKVGISTKLLELSEVADPADRQLGKGYHKGEAIASITNHQFIDEQELPNLLASRSVSNSKGIADYDQRLYFEEIYGGFVQFAQDQNGNAEDYLRFLAQKQIARYELEFTTYLMSDVENEEGSLDTAGLFLGDFEDLEISILGNTYTIVDARRMSTIGSNPVLSFMGGKREGPILEGETETYTVDDTEYAVEVIELTPETALFEINGVQVGPLADGETAELSDGMNIGVSDILYQAYQGGTHSVIIYLDAVILELQDDNIDDRRSSHVLRQDGVDITHAAVIIEGDDDNSTLEIDRISVNMSADKNVYVEAGDSLTESNDLAQPEVLFTQSWDILYGGLELEHNEDHEIVGVKALGNDDYELQFTDGNDNPVSLPLVNAVYAVDIPAPYLRLGDEDDDLILLEQETITKDDYFVVSRPEDDASAFAFRYRGADGSGDDGPTIRFKDLGSGQNIDCAFGETIGDAQATLNGETYTKIGRLSSTTCEDLEIGGESFDIYAASDTSSDDYDILIDFNGDGQLTNRVHSEVTIPTAHGAILGDWQFTPDLLVFTITHGSDDDYDDLEPTPIQIEVRTDSNGELDSSYVGPELYVVNVQAGVSAGYTTYGARIEQRDVNDINEIIVYYPPQQNLPEVFVCPLDIEVEEPFIVPPYENEGGLPEVAGKIEVESILRDHGCEAIRDGQHCNVYDVDYYEPTADLYDHFELFIEEHELEIGGQQAALELYAADEADDLEATGSLIERNGQFIYAYSGTQGDLTSAVYFWISDFYIVGVIIEDWDNTLDDFTTAETIVDGMLALHPSDLVGEVELKPNLEVTMIGCDLDQNYMFHPTIFVENTGTAPTNARAYVRIEDGPDDQAFSAHPEDWIRTVPTDTQPGQGSKLSLPTPFYRDQMTLTVKVDYDTDEANTNQVEESNENDNEVTVLLRADDCKEASFADKPDSWASFSCSQGACTEAAEEAPVECTGSSCPDLEITHIGCVEDTYGRPKVSVIMENTGTAASGPFRNYYEQMISVGHTTEDLGSPHSNLDAGTSTGTGAGTSTTFSIDGVTIEVDFNNIVQESDESDNTVTVDLSDFTCTTRANFDFYDHSTWVTHTCENGACVPFRKCIDSDEGSNNPFFHGNIQIMAGDQIEETVEDSCADSNTVNEYSCDGESYVVSQSNCDTESSCSNGVCVYPEGP